MKKKARVSIMVIICLALVSCQNINETATTSNNSNDSSVANSIVSSLTTNQSSASSGKDNVAEITVGPDGITYIDIKNILGITNLFEVRMLDEENAYVMGITDNQQNSAEGFMVWENILAKVNLKTGEVHDIVHGYFTNDGAENMFVQHLQDGSEMIFNGQAVFDIAGNKLKEQRLLEGKQKRDASYHAISNAIAFVDENTLNLSLYDTETSAITVLFESEKNKSGTVTQMPCHPYFSADGKKVLFQKTGENDLLYESIVGCDVDGKILFETDKLKRLSDVVHTGWAGEGFYIMQATDQSTDTPSGQATYFTICDQGGKIVKRFMLTGAIAGIQRSPYDNTVLAFRMLEPDSVLRYALGMVDLQSGNASIVHHSKGIITSQDLSPSGKLLAWVENDVICSMTLENVKPEIVPAKSWGE